MKAVIVDAQRFKNHDFVYEKNLFEKNEFEFEIKSCTNEEEVIEQCYDADVIMDVYTKIGAKAINAFTNCKAMIRYGIGFDVFNIEAATRRGIMVCNVPDYCISEVASHAATMILACARQLLYHTIHVRNGVWKSIPPYPKRRLSNQVLGLVGFGNIARQTAAYLKAFGFKMIAYDPFVLEKKFAELGVKSVSMEELCRESDYISIHIPLNEQTFHLINEEKIQTMKDGVVIVNTSRGAIICEEALIKALQSGKIGAVGLDVFENEPFEWKDHPFFNMNNVLLTPHVAYESAEASQVLRQRVAETALKVLMGGVPDFVVNRRELGL